MLPEIRSRTTEIVKRLGPTVVPIGVKLLSSARELNEIPGVRTLTSTMPCHMAMMARHEQSEPIIGAPSQATKCLWGAACLGLIKTPKRLSEGDLNLMVVKDEEAARKLHEGMCMLGDDRKYAGVIFAPLDHIPVTPDVIIMYLNPAQTLRLIIAFAYHQGEAINCTITGQASLCSAIARAVKDGSVTFDIPCMGDRVYGMVNENELIMAFPINRLDELVQGLQATDKIAPYPFSPFTRWTLVAPPP
ncbi:MAG: DUF169 domain-containing protein, partial [Euryarchaeota archaeon]|nr:DUF169 domain-containing protein [Euryarchaeota archaeon]